MFSVALRINLVKVTASHGFTVKTVKVQTGRNRLGFRRKKTLKIPLTFVTMPKINSPAIGPEPFSMLC